MGVYQSLAATSVAGKLCRPPPTSPQMVVKIESIKSSSISASNLGSMALADGYISRDSGLRHCYKLTAKATWPLRFEAKDTDCSVFARLSPEFLLLCI